MIRTCLRQAFVSATFITETKSSAHKRRERVSGTKPYERQVLAETASSISEQAMWLHLIEQGGQQLRDTRDGRRKRQWLKPNHIAEC
jgi:hypothetical protein